MTMYEAQRSQLSAGDHRTGMLYQRIAAVVEGDNMGDTGFDLGPEISLRVKLNMAF
jgi:hypothetical protein